MFAFSACAIGATSKKTLSRQILQSLSLLFSSRWSTVPSLSSRNQIHFVHCVKLKNRRVLSYVNKQFSHGSQHILKRSCTIKLYGLFLGWHMLLCVQIIYVFNMQSQWCEKSHYWNERQESCISYGHREKAFDDIQHIFMAKISQWT